MIQGKINLMKLTEDERKIVLLAADGTISKDAKEIDIASEDKLSYYCDVANEEIALDIIRIYGLEQAKKVAFTYGLPSSLSAVNEIASSIAETIVKEHIESDFLSDEELEELAKCLDEEVDVILEDRNQITVYESLEEAFEDCVIVELESRKDLEEQIREMAFADIKGFKNYADFYLHTYGDCYSLNSGRLIRYVR